LRIAARLLSPPVVTAEMDPRAAEGELFPAEESAVAKAIGKRRREFVAGRTCARRAMAMLGKAPSAIPQGDDRAPVWPEGLVGSISHADTWCVAALARTADGVRALGLDIEPAEPIDTSLLRIICLPEERDFIEAQPAEQRGLLGRLVFSAKEAAFKCQYALSRTMLAYHAMRVHLDVPAQRFVAVFQRDAAPFARGDALSGTLLVDRGYMMTAVVMSRNDPPALPG